MGASRGVGLKGVEGTGETEAERRPPGMAGMTECMGCQSLTGTAGRGTCRPCWVGEHGGDQLRTVG